MSIDLNSLAAVESFVKEFKKRQWPLHVLILNAGTREREDSSARYILARRRAERERREIENKEERERNRKKLK